MTGIIKWNLNAQVVEGPKILASDTIEIEAYDKIEVTIEAGGSKKEVQIQPGEAGQVQFLLIRSNIYDTALTYQINALGTDDVPTDTVQLDALQLFIGNGAIKLFNASPLEKLFFSNDLDVPALIEILVGRKATT